jgi:protein TonB
MQIQQRLPDMRFMQALGLAFLASTAFFTLLYSLISISGHGVEKAELLPTIDFVRLKRDTQTETLERRKPPPPPPPEAPPPPPKLNVATSETVQQAPPTPFAMPNLGLSMNVGGGPFIGELGSGAPMGGMFDGDIIPLQRIAPQYPRDAARAGINGWVKLEVLVNADGTVRSARVLESNPKGLFEASAVTAVMKWRFKPKIENGKPIEQRGSQRIEFSLRKGA